MGNSSNRKQQEGDLPLLVVRLPCKSLGEGIPTMRRIIGKARDLQRRGYELSELTVYAAMILPGKEDTCNQEGKRTLGMP